MKLYCSSWSVSQSTVVSFYSTLLAQKSLPSYSASLDMKNGRRLKVKYKCSLCFPLVCTYAISFLLMTPFFSFFSAYNSLSLITLKIALTLIPFCCQGLVVGAGTGSPLYSSILTFACLGHTACLSSYRKGLLLQL